ncbi:hypothetical protein FHE72_20735 [Rossellomorea vietnamensis]|uniref:Uncharacterized protein n=1 Tax=Rossellomorea vietnamensis TaxID=218284 RepID=A0A6I6UJL7_9BACI|nr:hypothetical protein [Rossellomorea vietnamensis]QHE63165.1 hypothetical protein FHE72_20735 [Rossellomorea vietnamensis]
MDLFYEELKKIGMSVEYELNQWIVGKLDDPEVVAVVKQWLELVQTVLEFIQLLSLLQALNE